ncbi:type IV secretory system conjugative DNA transfer family protein [Methylosinus sp. Sm6]|uniref:type IV secretory system conjugative DNA transfer family protein n=1 Tax=Methylosinus sp. Sm6 TaxID=2866948 RepID=UPI001C9A2133|nr:type IV secretory system conjugative DNA transfer family protein [Methylosinus sp. Sm6]MBY6240055.1 type IV secretion system DNA-binding domain-containing protein [Methylosinus sp. Sm6]
MRDGYSGDTWLILASGLGLPALIAGATATPKNAAYAAPDRLVLTVLVFAVTLAGVAILVTATRRRADRRMAERYGPASSAVRDTLTYLRHEQRLARRGRLAALLGSIGAFGLYLLAHWPQMGALAPFRDALGSMSLLLFAAIPALALKNRGNHINTWFLKRYLAQQIEHLGYRPGARRPISAMRPEEIVTTEAPGRFRIAGFPWTFDDFMKNAAVFGQVGSGKTVCVLNSLLVALIASSSDAPLSISGLVLDAKGDFYGKLQRLCERLGRADDLYVVDPGAWGAAARTRRSIAWNPLDNADDALEVATRLVAALRLLGLEQGNDGSYFLDAAKAFLRHGIVLVRAAAGGEAPSLIDVYHLSQEGEAETPLYHRLLVAIAGRFPGATPQEVDDAIGYFEKNWAAMADREKSGVRGTITQLLDEFLVPPFREMFTGRSTISIADVIDKGKILYVHMPAADRERMSRVVNTLVKLEFQRQILRRPGKERPSFFLCDEFQTFYTSGEGRGDSDFFERSRESRHANIVAAQNISAFLKRTRNPHDVKNFLGNCAVKIFLRNTEEETNRWASGLFGQRSEIVITTSEQAAFDGGLSRRRHTNYGRATRTLPRVPPEAFAQLAVPMRGEAARQYADSIIHLGSRGEAEHHAPLWPVNPLR